MIRKDHGPEGAGRAVVGAALLGSFLACVCVALAVAAAVIR